MCTGDRLLADFVAGTAARPRLPEELREHLTTTVDGLWVVWAYKVAWQKGDLFVPLTGGNGYPADATARCRARRRRRIHRAPQPACTCGFHALSSRDRDFMLSHLVDRGLGREVKALTVALSGRVLAFEWAGQGVLWRAERQTVVRIERPRMAEIRNRLLGDTISWRRPHPGDPDGRPAIVHPAQPQDSGPIRLDLPVSCPVLPLCHDDTGWCVASTAFEPSPISQFSELMAEEAPDGDGAWTRSTRPTVVTSPSRMYAAR